MFPTLLKGHERSITCVQFNHAGDLLFTASKDGTPMVWRTANGERLGTYNGHSGAIWSLAVSEDSLRCASLPRSFALSVSALGLTRSKMAPLVLLIYRYAGPVTGSVVLMSAHTLYAAVSPPSALSHLCADHCTRWATPCTTRRIYSGE